LDDDPHEPETVVRPPVRILHVSADFPDPLVPNKTPVIETFLRLTGDTFDHRVISINRRALAGLAGILPGTHAAVAEFAPFAWGECLTYAAPGRGLFHRSHLVRLGDAIADRLRGAPLPDLVVGHKLTVEGIVVQRIAERTGLPFAITVQGNTDAKILAARPDLAPCFRTIFHAARGVTAFAPWAIDLLEAKLGKRSGPVAMIPCPTELDTPLAPRAGGNGLLSVFHLHGHANKNLAGMAEALRILDRRGRARVLAIGGGGSEADLAAARRNAGDAPGLVFEGPLPREAVAARMNAATAFVLPSFRESFGLVFVEALFAGLPIIYPKGAAVSGWFDDCPFALGVPAREPEALAAAMDTAVREEGQLKAALAEWQAAGGLERFGRSAIARDYAAALNAAAAQRTR
jgi:glycosyltransferase involved in cell wall biosynthesis